MTLEQMRKSLMSDAEREFFEERAAIMEYDGGFSRFVAEFYAFQCLKILRKEINRKIKKYGI